jgi:hypothetical protein
MARVRETRGGRDYDAAWGVRMTGTGLHAELIRRRFQAAVRRLGLDTVLPPLRADLFRVPREGPEQLSLFPG